MNQSRLKSFWMLLALAAGALATAVPATLADDKADKKKSDQPPTPIAVAELKRDAPVDFEKEILPILSKHCLACHNATKNENNMVLETPQTILKGGENGPGVAPKKSADSLLFKVASHQVEPTMPPDDNEVKATPMSPDELALVRLWIDQGATGAVTGQVGPIKWQPLPPGVNPIYAVAITQDGQYAACGRANQIFLYNVPSGRLVTRLSDPAILAAGLYKSQGVAHLDLVQSLSFSPDGEILASGSYREVKLWRRPHSTRKLDLIGGGEAAQVVAISADGKWAATGETNGSIKLWNLATGKDPKPLMGHTAAITGLKFLPNGEQLVSASQDKTIRLWKLADGSAAGQIDAPAPINALELVADGSQVAAAGADNIVRIWPLPTGAAKDLPPLPAAITALAVLPTDKTQLFCATADGAVRQINLQNNQVARQFDNGSPVAAIAVRGDGLQMASAGANNQIKLWNLQNGQAWTPNNQPVPEMKGDLRAQLQVARLQRVVARLTAKVADCKKSQTDAEAQVTATAEAMKKAATDKEAAAKALADKTAAVKAPTEAKAAADKALEVAQATAKAAVEKAAQAKASADQNPGNADLAKANEEARKAAEEADRLAKEAEKKVQEAAGPATKATQELTAAEAANMAADQAMTAAQQAIQKAAEAIPVAQNAVKAAEGQMAQTQQTFEAAKQAAPAAEKPIKALAYSADNTLLASGGENPVVRTWSAETGLPLDTFEGHQAPVLALAFAPDGGLLSSGADKALVEWNVSPEWKLERAIGNVDNPALLVDRVLALSFSPDSKLLATGGGEPSRSGELKIWNVADGSLVRAIADAHSDTVFGLAFSPEGNYLASSAADRFMKVFDVASGKLVRSFEGHTHHVLGVAWRTDGKMLASAGADSVIKVWDFTTGDQKLTTPPLGKEVTSISFVPDKPQIMVTSGDKTVRLYNSESGGNDRNFPGGADFMYSTAVADDGKVAIGGGQDSVLFVWNVDNGQTIRTLEPPKASKDELPKK